MENGEKGELAIAAHCRIGGEGRGGKKARLFMPFSARRVFLRGSLNVRDGEGESAILDHFIAN